MSEQERKDFEAWRQRDLIEAPVHTSGSDKQWRAWRARAAIAQQSEREPLSRAAQDVLVERQRQISVEGYEPEHDDEHVCDEIAALACFYAMPPAARDWPANETSYGATFGAAMVPEEWTVTIGDRRRELVKAGALILAEIERLDRAGGEA